MRVFWRWLLAIFFVAAGLNHFVNPAVYMPIMPSYLPWPAGLIWLSGAAEILGGMGVLLPRTRVFAGGGLLALLVAVFPANLNAAFHGWQGVNLPQWLLWLRLPFQFLFGWWVYRVCLFDSNVNPSGVDQPDDQNPDGH
jgi:uncharacterized membrane protein